MKIAAAANPAGAKPFLIPNSSFLIPNSEIPICVKSEGFTIAFLHEFYFNTPFMPLTKKLYVV